MAKQWIGVDLDGTLAERQTNGIGEPVAPMWERVRKWQAEGRDVRIFTVRAATTGGAREVSQWLRRHGLPALEVTALKSPGLVALWDDRAVRVETDTGRVCAGCAGAAEHSHGHHANGLIVLTDC